MSKRPFYTFDAIINPSEEELAKYIKIDKYRTRNGFRYFNDFYYDNENKRFIRKINGYYYTKRPNPMNQRITVVDVDGRMVHMSYSELEKQYHSISGLYDNTRLKQTNPSYMRLVQALKNIGKKNENEKLESQDNESTAETDFSLTSIVDDVSLSEFSVF